MVAPKVPKPYTIRNPPPLEIPNPVLKTPMYYSDETPNQIKLDPMMNKPASIKYPKPKGAAPPLGKRMPTVKIKHQ